MSLFDFFKNPKDLKELDPEDINLDDKKFVLIDVRTRGEYNRGHIKGSVNYPLGNEDKIINDVGIVDNVLLICKTGHRSRASANRLVRQGFKKIYHIKGGMDNWRKKGFDEEK